MPAHALARRDPHARDVWAEILKARRALHEHLADQSWEVLPSSDRGWAITLLDLTSDVVDSAAGINPVDPRQALIDLTARATAWIDAMDLRPGIADPPGIVDLRRGPT